jgi:crotonobetainyl-CoA:carnitine CoA-transferase CaiB-like acyl-CoA transferase
LLESGGFTDVSLPDGHTVKLPLLPFEMDGRRFGARLDVPSLGSHSEELLRELGYSEVQIDHLRDAGVINVQGQKAIQELK